MEKVEAKIMFDIVCSNKECDAELERPYCTRTDFLEVLKGTCPKCGSPVKQDMGFGAGRFRGSGFTKRSC